MVEVWTKEGMIPIWGLSNFQPGFLKFVAGKCGSPIANGQDAPCIDLTIDSSAAHRTLPVPLNLV